MTRIVCETKPRERKNPKVLTFFFLYVGITVECWYANYFIFTFFPFAFLPKY